MTPHEREKLASLFLKLKKANRVYQVATEEQRGRLLENCQPIFDQLRTLGVEQAFAETLVICGKDFVDTLDSQVDLKEQAGVAIFG